MSKLSRTEAVMLRNQVAIMKALTELPINGPSGRVTNQARLFSCIGYTSQYVQDNFDD